MKQVIGLVVGIGLIVLCIYYSSVSELNPIVIFVPAICLFAAGIYFAKDKDDKGDSGEE